MKLKYEPMKKLTIMRIQKGIKQKDLAELINVKPNTVCSYEKGYNRPPVDILIKIANVFNCTIEELL